MSESAKPTPLHDFHRQQGAKFAPFAGYDMPLQYAGGIIAEHNWTRSSASLFDVSHMGQIHVSAGSGTLADAALEIEKCTPVDVAGLPEGRHQYGLLTSEEGGILDDVIIGNCGDRFLIVVNASRKQEDLGLLASAIGGSCQVTLVSGLAMIALQGPDSETALARIFPASADLRFMTGGEFKLSGEKVWISRTGYSGEDGFEISLPAGQAAGLAGQLAAMDEVKPAGLGARDSLRLEAGLCLYGNDIDSATSPVEAGLAWTIQSVRRTGGSRPGGYPGWGRIERELSQGPARRRVGLRPEGRAPMRRGTELFEGMDGGDAVGIVTSGGFGPTVGGPVSMGYVDSDRARAGLRLFGEVRGRRQPVGIERLPFVRGRRPRQRSD